MASFLRNRPQYDQSTPFYSGYDATGLINQYQQGPTRSTMDAELDPYGHIGSNWRGGQNSVASLRDGHMILQPTNYDQDRYLLADGRQVEGGEKAPVDFFKNDGTYDGSSMLSLGKTGVHAMMPSVVKALTMAMIGGGFAGALGAGPMTSSGGFFNPGMAGAGGGAGAAGMGGAAFGDAGLMYAGADAAAAGTLGGGYMGGLGGTAALGAAGGGGAAGLGGLGGGVVPPNPYVSGGGMFGGSGSSSLGGLGSMFGGGGGSSNLLGLGSSLIGGLTGGQGQSASRTETSKMDPRLEPYLYGDLFPRAQSTLAGQVPNALNSANALNQVGMGLLGTDTTPNMAENPYLTSAADDIARRTQELLGQNNLAIQGNAVASGGLGGSRQGVAQGMAAGQAADSLQGNLANLYYGAYNQDANRALGKVTLGSGLLGQGVQMPWAPMQQASDIYRPYTGLNSSITSGTKEGGGWQGALGGLLAGASLGSQAGWW